MCQRIRDRETGDIHRLHLDFIVSIDPLGQSSSERARKCKLNTGFKREAFASAKLS